MARKDLLISVFLGSLLSIGMVSDAAPPIFFNNTASLPTLMLDGPSQLSAAQSSSKPLDTGRRIKKARPTTTTPNSIGLNKSFNRIPNASANKNLVTLPQNKPILTAAQKSNLNTLVSTIKNTTAEVRFDWRNGTPSFIKVTGAPLIPLRALNKPQSSAQDIAAMFLDENSRLLKLNNPKQELRLISETAEPSGKKHLRFQQQFQGLDVWGQQLGLHLNKGGIYLLNGRFTPTPAIDINASVTPEAAMQTAKNDFGSMNAEVSTPQLLIFTDQKSMVLAFKLELSVGLSERWLYFIDARTNKVVNKINNLHTVGEVVAASGQDLQGQNQNFNAWRDADTFYMIDPSIPSPESGDPVNDGPNARGDTFILDARNKEQGSLSFITSPQNNAGWDPVAVSAMRNTLAVYRYFLDNFQRKSLDDQNENLMAIVHVGNDFNNAAWNGTQMIYGDGDGKIFQPLAKCLDVAAHEMTHGVTQHTANFVYQNQSGALNESFSDVFAAMVDRNNWTMGEECTIAAPGFVRNMQDPATGLTPQPGHMSEYKNLLLSVDNGGVHINSGIPNRAAYLLAEGLSSEGLGTSIGREKTEKIYYRALTTYLTASSQFIDARRALIQSAEDLYGAGSTDAASVAAAWDSVGVIEGGMATPDNNSPTPSTSIAGDDLMVYLFPRDGTRDESSDDVYDLYVQSMESPFSGYIENNDKGPLNSVPVQITPPTAITDSTGTSIFYTGSDGNIYFINPDGRNEQLTSSGDVWSIAVAPDGSYFAYTTADPSDKTIHIININTKKVTDFPLQPPNYQDGNVDAVNTIRYADSIAFDYTGTKIVFDALNCLSLPNNSCEQEDGGYQYWSIGMIDVVEGSIFYPFSNQNPDIDLGYPRFAANNNFVIAVDMQDYSDFATKGLRSRVVTINFEQQKISDVIDYGFGRQPFWGVPSFWGNDDFVTVQVPLNSPALIGAARIPLMNDWVGDPTRAEEVNPFAVAWPQMHRAGVRDLSGALTINAAMLDFANVPLGSGRDLSVVIKNVGNRDVNISNIAIDSNAFTHNATNTVLPQGASMPITVKFKPDSGGTHIANMTIDSDGEPGSMNVSLTGIAGADALGGTGSNTSKPPSSGGNSGGGPIDLWLIGMLFLGIAGLRFRQTKDFVTD